MVTGNKQAQPARQQCRATRLAIHFKDLNEVWKERGEKEMRRDEGKENKTGGKRGRLPVEKENF